MCVKQHIWNYFQFHSFPDGALQLINIIYRTTSSRITKLNRSQQLSSHASLGYKFTEWKDSQTKLRPCLKDGYKKIIKEISISNRLGFASFQQCAIPTLNPPSPLSSHTYRSSLRLCEGCSQPELGHGNPQRAARLPSSYRAGTLSETSGRTTGEGAWSSEQSSPARSAEPHKSRKDFKESPKAFLRAHMSLQPLQPVTAGRVAGIGNALLPIFCPVFQLHESQLFFNTQLCLTTWNPQLPGILQGH